MTHRVADTSPNATNTELTQSWAHHLRLAFEVTQDSVAAVHSSPRLLDSAATRQAFMFTAKK